MQKVAPLTPLSSQRVRGRGHYFFGIRSRKRITKFCISKLDVPEQFSGHARKLHRRVAVACVAVPLPPRIKLNDLASCWASRTIRAHLFPFAANSSIAIHAIIGSVSSGKRLRSFLSTAMRAFVFTRTLICTKSP